MKIITASRGDCYRKPLLKSKYFSPIFSAVQWEQWFTTVDRHIVYMLLCIEDRDIAEIGENYFHIDATVLFSYEKKC